MTHNEKGQINDGKDDAMVHWGWVVFALFAGAIIGMFVFAFLEVSREDKKRKVEKK